MIIRSAIVSVTLLLGAAYIASASHSESPPLRRPLAEIPWEIGVWNGHRASDFDQRTLDVLRVDEYINRVYDRPADQSLLGLYVGYYASQREGSTMHSPLNCLPAAGWVVSKGERRVITVPDFASPATNRSIEVNRMIISKGLDRQLVLYWYQSHDRIVASEYWGRFYLVVDAIRLNRTDGAMVRVVTPIQGTTGEAETAAEAKAVEFVQTLFPLLGQSLPS